ncbi:MAG: PQ-loop repeat-containing protein [Patescibacteria group bacterium]|nr:PQ-loop repeat-containing protein [Patescibacteria group bacterium]
MNFDLAQILGWIATVLFSVMLIPQMVKTIKVKDTSGVSLFLFVIYLVANIIALAYAMLIDQSPLIIKYSIAIGTALAYLGIFAYYYKKREARKHESAE